VDANTEGLLQDQVQVGSASKLTENLKQPDGEIEATGSPLYTSAPFLVENQKDDVSDRRFWAPGEAGDEDPTKRVPHRARALVEEVARAMGMGTKSYAERFTVKGNKRWGWSLFPTPVPSPGPTLPPTEFEEYEWANGFFALWWRPLSKKLSKLEKEERQAVKLSDYLQADKLKKEEEKLKKKIAELKKKAVHAAKQLKKVEQDIFARQKEEEQAVDARDYLRAHKLKVQIAKLKKDADDLKKDTTGKPKYYTLYTDNTSKHTEGFRALFRNENVVPLQKKVSKLKEEQRQAVRLSDYLKADKLKKEEEELEKQIVELKRKAAHATGQLRKVERGIFKRQKEETQAVHVRDYLRAHKLKVEIVDLRKEAADLKKDTGFLKRNL